MINSAEEFVRLRTSDRMEDYSLAANGTAPLSVWLDVIARFPDMKTWVAHNKTVPLEILEILAADSARSVRAAVADKRKLSEALFQLLSSDSDEGVRQRIACNKKTPIAIVRRLAEDPVPLVRDAALKRIEELGSHLANGPGR